MMETGRLTAICTWDAVVGVGLEGDRPAVCFLHHVGELFARRRGASSDSKESGGGLLGAIEGIVGSRESVPESGAQLLSLLLLGIEERAQRVLRFIHGGGRGGGGPGRGLCRGIGAGVGG